MLLSLHKEWLESKILIFIALCKSGRFSVTDALKAYKKSGLNKDEKKSAVRFERVQRFVVAKIVFWG